MLPKSRRTPSFSSTLLESIYRSIDESHCEKPAGILDQRRKQSGGGRGFESLCEEAANFRRAVPVERRGGGWVSSCLSNSASSSSDSSYGGGVFSSSEAESNVGEKGEESRSGLRGLKPIGTRDASDRIERPEMPTRSEERNFHPQPKIEGRFTKTKLRALKMYGDLKRAKYPISPGGRIASFLASIFNPGSPKKSPKSCPIDQGSDMFSEHRKSKSVQESVPPSSRSCLSSASAPNPSSRGGGGGSGSRRCVRFCPVSVILDENSHPCGHKTFYREEPGDPSLTPTPSFVKIAESRDLKNRAALGNQRMATEVAAGTRNYLMREFQQKHGSILSELGWRARREEREMAAEEEEDDDDDTESCASSDLFELDNLAGIGRHRQELPVYETTSLRTNQAIANGLILR